MKIKVRALSPSQRAQYRKQGYLFLGRVMDPATLQDFRRAESRFRRTPTPDDPPALLGPELTMFRSQVCSYSAPVRDYLLGAPLVPLARQLIGTNNLLLWYNQFVTKFTDVKKVYGEFPWHQDDGYTSLSPHTDVVFWIALDDCHEGNGCVWVMPGSHRNGLVPHQRKSSDSWHLKIPLEGDGVPARLKAGEAIAFSGLIMHRSKENFTAQPRRGFIVNYCDAAASVVEGPTSTPAVRVQGRWVVSGQAPL